MAVQEKKKTSYDISPQAAMLARQAYLELSKGQKTDVVCPKCGKHPTLTTVENREFLSCKCRYIRNMIIFF